MEKWRRVWRFGVVPQLSRHALLALRSGLERDDRALLQGTISSPTPLEVNRDCEVAGACAIGYCGWRGEGKSSVGEVEAYFHRICDAADAVLAEPAACRFFLNWFDDVPRAQMRRELLAEVTLALREVVGVAA